ncbi:MFS transporter [Danxiaibacter flavus]|uniref:MFS transporter n=1 Tax=Danxiaibacter flavus TaxID=3049108 RepID=A0ABV3ZGB3_9BACT|nr:MFS transporter [Chitinophagaceae bacterium DXS]
MFSRKNVILIVASTAVFFEALDIAILNLAIPLIRTQFHLENDVMQWLQTVYVLLYGGFLIMGGKLSDTVGRKKVFVAGSALFLVTSLGAGLSSSFGMLVFFRGLQGLAAAMVMPAAMSIITNTFTDPRERNKAISIFSSFAAVGSGCGLSVGGIIATHMGWQWVFFINVPVIALALLLALKYIDNDQPANRPPAPDVVSAVLLIIVILLLSYIVHGMGDISNNILPLSIAVLAAVSGAAFFIRRSKKITLPYIDFSLFKDTHTIAGNGVTILMGAIFSGYLFAVSLVFQQNMQYTAAHAGLLLFPFSICSALVSKFVVPGILKKLSLVKTSILGMTLMLTGTLLLILSMQFHYNLPLLLLSAACITGTGMSVSFPGLTVMSMHHIPTDQHGLAASVCTTSYFLGAGLGLSILSLIMQITKSGESLSYLPVTTLSFYAFTGILWLISILKKK